MKDRVSTKILDNGATRYGVYDETGALLRYEYIKLEDEPTVEGDLFSKANMLPDSIPAALGLKMGNPQVKDALNVLANIGNVHVWGKRLYELTGVIADATDATATVYLNNGYYLYAKAEIVNGEIVCSEKLELYSSPANYVGYYAYNGVNVYRVTSNSYSSSTGYSFTGILQEVKSQSIPGSIVSYVVSTDPNAYPQDGDLDGVHYTYVGVLGDRTRIEVGSYVGTGTYGSSVPNTLTFGFEPKLVFVFGRMFYNTSNLYASLGVFAPDQLTDRYIKGGYWMYSPGRTHNSNRDCYAKKVEKTLSWYSDDSAIDQLNGYSSDYTATYTYFAFG